MTDPHDHDFDELASAHLDGATSPDEAARVAGDAALQARVEELRAVRDAVGEVPPVDPARREAAIEAALAAFDEGAGATITPLAPRRRVSPAALRVLGAAAVIAIVALLVPLLAGLGDGDDDQATATFEETGEALGGAEDAATGGGGATAPEASTTAPASAAFGDAANVYDDVDALAAAITAGELETRASDTQDDAPPEVTSSCPTPAGADRVYETAVVAGEPVIVWLGTTAEGTRLLTVTAIDGCRLLDQREL